MWRRKDCGGGEDGVRALIEFLENERSCQTKGERESLCRGRERDEIIPRGYNMASFLAQRSHLEHGVV